MEKNKKDYVEALKRVACKYGFHVLESDRGADLACRNTDGELFRQICYDQEKDTVFLAGNTDLCNLWFHETRPDLTPGKLISFVRELNLGLEIQPPFELRALVDPEDWQEIADVQDA